MRTPGGALRATPHDGAEGADTVLTFPGGVAWLLRNACFGSARGGRPLPSFHIRPMDHFP
jgi:hypothetical protein